MAEKKGSKFEKGRSGNPSGRPKGATNKHMTLNQMQKHLSSGNLAALATVSEVISNQDVAPNVRLKAALEWLAFDLKVRDAIEKKVLSDMEKEAPTVAKQKREADKQGEKEDEATPVVSLVAVD